MPGVLEPDQQRRILDKAPVSVHQLCQLVQGAQVGTGQRLPDVAPNESAVPGGEERNDLVGVDPRVPDLERPQCGVLGHPLAVGAARRPAPPRSAAAPGPRCSETRLRGWLASRLRSHSKGPGSVSSKSLTSKTMLRSGVANWPKLPTWASPQAWTRRPLVGVVARSSAITSAEPRKNANGDSLIREYSTPSSSGTRVCARFSASRPDRGGRAPAPIRHGRCVDNFPATPSPSRTDPRQ